MSPAKIAASRMEIRNGLSMAKKTAAITIRIKIKYGPLSLPALTV
jgi:hypothetical protein